MTLEGWAKLLTAVSGFAWPAAGVAIAFFFRRFIAQMLTRESVSIKIAGMEVSVADAAKQTGSTLADLVERVAQLEDSMRVTQGTGAKSPVELGRARGSPESVLWVDDYPSNNAFLIQKFEQDGISVRKEISTDAGLAALQQESFSAIISDLGRNENGVSNPFAGLDFVKAVRESGSQTPILIFAGTRGLENRDKLISAGANEVTASPVDVYRFVTERSA